MVAEAHRSAQAQATRSALIGAVRLDHVWVLLIIAGATIGPLSSPLTAPDVFWSLRRGALMLEQRSLVLSDPLTSAPHVSPPHVNVQWLADLIFRMLERGGGLGLVVVGSALVIAATYGITLSAAHATSRHVRFSCLAVALAYGLGVTNLLARPQTLAYPLFAVFVLATARPDSRLLWLLPVLTAVWANVHGSFFVGLLLLACLAFGQPRRNHFLTLGVCALATLATPYGFGTFESIVRVGTNPIIREQVPEWAPTTIGSLEGAAFFAAVVLLVSLALTSRTRLTRTDVLVTLSFAALALASVRGVVWFGLAVAPIIARLLAGLELPSVTSTRERPWLNLAIAVGILALVTVSLPWFKQLVPVLPADKRGVIGVDAPADVAKFLNEWEPPPNGRMLNFELWGGYFDWAVWPQHQPFIDGRFELYPPNVWRDYVAIVTPTARWRELLDAYAISYAVLSQSEQAELIQLLRQQPDWRVTYADAQAVVLVRQPRADASGPRTSTSGARTHSAPAWQ